MERISQKLKIWVGLIIILASLYVYYLGYSIHLIDPKVDRNGFIAAIWTHVGFASLLFVPVIASLLIRKESKSLMPTKSWETWVIRLFKITFALKLITGPLTVWSRGSALKVFDWFKIPSPVERMDGPYEFFEAFHKLLAYPFILFLALTLCVIILRISKSRYHLS